MFALLSTDSITVTTTPASGVNLSVHASWVDYNSSTGAYTAGRTNKVIASNTTTTVVASPASGVIRTVEFVSVSNTNAAVGGVTVGVTVNLTDGTNNNVIWGNGANGTNVLGGYTLTYDNNGWVVADAAGQVQATSPPIGTLLRRAVLTATATENYTTSAECNSLCIKGVAGGGGGQSINGVTSEGGGGGGGGAGGYFEYYVSEAADLVITYKCGAAGAASGSGGSTVVVVGATTVTANSGVGTAAGGASASPSVFKGSAGGSVSTNGSVNCGGAPGMSGFCLNVTALAISGNGGSSPFGRGGVGVAITSSASSGNAGTGFGSGGSGGVSLNSSTGTGGVGSQGCVVIEEYS